MMLKEKKIDFQRGCEEYIEEQGLYEIFEDMMRSLIVNKPEDPVKFLIDKLEKPESKYKVHSARLPAAWPGLKAQSWL